MGLLLCLVVVVGGGVFQHVEHPQVWEGAKSRAGRVQGHGSATADPAWDTARCLAGEI